MAGSGSFGVCTHGSTTAMPPLGPSYKDDDSICQEARLCLCRNRQSFSMLLSVCMREDAGRKKG